MHKLCMEGSKSLLMVIPTWLDVGSRILKKTEAQRICDFAQDHPGAELQGRIGTQVCLILQPFSSSSFIPLCCAQLFQMCS